MAHRDEIVLATKIHGQMHEGPNGAGLSRKAIMPEIDKRLKRLGTDYVDLYCRKKPYVLLLVPQENPSWKAVGSLSVKLTPEEFAFLEKPYVPHSIVGHN